MSAAITGIIVAVVAGVFGVGGAAFTANREHQKWLRQQRLEAYVRLLAEVSNASGGTNHVRAVARLVAELSDVRDRVRAGEDPLELLEAPAVRAAAQKEKLETLATVADALGQACSTVELLGPREVGEAAEELRSAALDELLAAVGDHAGGERINQASSRIAVTLLGPPEAEDAAEELGWAALADVMAVAQDVGTRGERINEAMRRFIAGARQGLESHR